MNSKYIHFFVVVENVVDNFYTNLIVYYFFDIIIIRLIRFFVRYLVAF